MLCEENPDLKSFRSSQKIVKKQLTVRSQSSSRNPKTNHLQQVQSWEIQHDRGILVYEQELFDKTMIPNLPEAENQVSR